MHKVKLLSKELRGRCRGGDTESLIESLQVLIHNDVTQLIAVKKDEEFRWIQGHLQAFEEILSLINNT